jgi:hypothetical protein
MVNSILPIQHNMLLLILLLLVVLFLTHSITISNSKPANDNEYEPPSSSSMAPTSAPSRRSSLPPPKTTQCKNYKKNKYVCCQRTADCNNNFVPTGCLWVKKKCVPKTLDLPSDCLQRQDGAFIQFSIMDEDFIVWSTNNQFIDEALRLRRLKSTRTPVFNLQVGYDSCSSYNFFPDPNDMKFVDVPMNCRHDTPSVISGLPNISNLRWCPWGAYKWTIFDLRDRRRRT